ASTGQKTALMAWPAVQGTVHAAIPDGSGGFYIGGGFAKVGTYDRFNLAHILSNGAVDPNFGPVVVEGGRVFALALSGSTLIIGGEFTSIGGTTRNRIAALNATTGALASSWSTNVPSLNGTVLSMALNG